MIQIGHSKQELKSNFPWRDLELLLIYSSRLWVEVLNCLLIEMSKDQQVWIMNEMQAMNSMQQKQKTQVQVIVEIKIKRQAIANTKNLF